MRTLAACVVSSLALSMVEVASATDGVAVSVRPSGAVHVPVLVDGQGPFTFLLDTGSSHTAVSHALADRLGLPVVAKVRVLTPAGPEAGLVVKAQRIEVGGARVEALTPSVVSIARLREREPGVEGVLGQDFLSLFDYTVDYRRKQLRWTAESAAGSVPVPLVVAGDRRLARLPGATPEQTVLLVPDTGADGLVLFERGGRIALKVDYEDHVVNVSGLGSTRAARGARLRELRVGGITLRNQPAVVLEREGSSAVVGDGLLPLHQFSSVSFNNREGYLVFRR